MADPDARPAGPPTPGQPAERRQFLKWLSGGFLSLWALGGAGGGLLNLGDPRAREWLIQHVDRMITEANRRGGLDNITTIVVKIESLD